MSTIEQPSLLLCDSSELTEAGSGTSAHDETARQLNDLLGHYDDEGSSTLWSHMSAADFDAHWND